jgi:hypothetical protein
MQRGDIHYVSKVLEVCQITSPNQGSICQTEGTDRSKSMKISSRTVLIRKIQLISPMRGNQKSGEKIKVVYTSIGEIKRFF